MLKKIRYWPVTAALVVTMLGGLVSLVVAQVQDNDALKTSAFAVLVAVQGLLAIVLPQFTTAWKKVLDLAPAAADLLSGKVQP